MSIITTSQIHTFLFNFHSHIHSNSHSRHNNVHNQQQHHRNNYDGMNHGGNGYSSWYNNNNNNNNNNMKNMNAMNQSLIEGASNDINLIFILLFHLSNSKRMIFCFENYTAFDLLPNSKRTSAYFWHYQVQKRDV